MSSPNATVVVTGATGLLGRAVMQQFQDHELKGWSIIGLGRRRVAGRSGYQSLDLADEAGVRDLVRRERPACVINLAAERRPDHVAANPKATETLNVRLPQLLGELAECSGCWVLHLSTDYVFDGTSPPYRPDSVPKPTNEYGEGKLRAEQALQAAHPGCGVLRVPVLYGPVEDLGESAVTVLAKDLLPRPDGRRPTHKKVDDWSVRYPTHVDDVAIVIRQLVARKLGLVSGIMPEGNIWHWSSNQERAPGVPFTKYTLSLLMAELVGADASHLQPDPEPPKGALRPKDCHLDSSILRSAGIGQDTDVATGFASSIRPFFG